mmetsp:Transcript_14203/g.53362  ORF Transcript_14203/g.53362 Transcript_14203/m.53362 type:complete len:136 (+) Transcript_14203:1550-1957(+)
MLTDGRKTDHVLVLEATRRCGWHSLLQALYDRRDNRDIAHRGSGSACFFTLAELKGRRRIFVAAPPHTRNVLEHVVEKLSGDCGVVKVAVEETGDVHGHASTQWRAGSRSGSAPSRDGDGYLPRDSPPQAACALR